MLHYNDSSDARDREPSKSLDRAGRWPGSPRLVVCVILVVALVLRLLYLGRLSLWYDEVVAMTLARQPNPQALLRMLFEIDATRAPLHPLFLHAWLHLFGPSDIAGRALSATCGVATVALLYRLGRTLFDAPTALWAAWLAAISPLLVRYSQEARMYSLLVFVTCLSWDLLLRMRQSERLGWQVVYSLSLIALVYSHPLGLFMVAAHGLAYLANRSAFRITLARWLAIQAVVVVAVAPWVPHYLDHAPEITSGSLAIRFLLGLPIGFTGGGRLTLLGCVVLIACGLLTLRPRVAVRDPAASSILLIWFAVPPLMLYAYSLVSHPLFGPARYTLFVAPAYLLLLARGLAKVPRYVRYPLALVLAAQAGLMLSTDVYAPGLKADWRAAGAWLESGHPEAFDTVVVVTENPANTVEVKTAGYYVRPQVHLITMGEALASPETVAAASRSPWVVFAVPLRAGTPVVAIPASLLRVYDFEGGSVDFPGLRLIWRRHE